MNRLAKVFELNPKGLNIPRGLTVAAVVMVVPLVVLGLLDLEKYWISLAFAALFVGLSDPGGDYRVRVREMGGVVLVGAVLTAVGFAIGDGPWGWVVLAAFVVTLLSGLAIKFGVHRFVAGLLLNVWFLIALGLPDGFAADHVTTSAWAQTLAWLIGAAIWIGATVVMWLARGRRAQASHVPEIPWDTSPRPLTKQVVLFALIRADALAISVAIAFGLDLPEAYWLPIATLVAMKPSLEQSVLVAEQRLVGAILGAALAALFLLTVTNQHVLEVVIVVPSGGGVHPRRELRPLHRGDRRARADRSGPCPPVRLCNRGAAGALHLRRRGDRRRGDAPREPAPEAHPHSGVTGNLTRAGSPRSVLVPLLGVVWARAGALIHIDTARLARFWQPGHRTRGRG